MMFVVSIVIGICTQTLVSAQSAGYADGPEPLGIWEPSNSLDSIEGIAINGNYVYLAVNGFGIQILDVSDPTNPEEVNSFALDGTVKNVHYTNNKLYVGASSKLLILDVQDPMSPRSIVNLTQHSTVYNVAVVGSYIYIADHSGSLMIAQEYGNLYPRIDKANDYWCFGVVVKGDYAYTATSSQGLVIWDVSDKTNPVIVGEQKAGDNVYAIAAYGDDKVVLGGRAGYLAVFDISSQTDPLLLGELAITSDIGKGQGLQVYEDTLIAADYTDGIVTLDISEGTPEQGNRLFPSGTRGYAVEIDNQYVYGGMGFFGFMIWDLDEAIKSRGGSGGPGEIGFTPIDTLIGLSTLTLLTYFHRKRYNG